jgi:hypothetical protein
MRSKLAQISMITGATREMLTSKQYLSAREAFRTI